ncbi:hypothetical protein GS474_15985 [Rhodococcus hoagii]|nr:hypothetical protein [Prescottella equi]
MAGLTFYQQAMGDVQDFLVAKGFKTHDPAIGHLQRLVNTMIRDAWIAGTKGESLNEPKGNAA